MPSVSAPCQPGLARQLGLFDATMIVMGGIIGSGIFINPHVVAERVHAPAQILGAWFAGGLVAMGGAFIWAELSSERPYVGGQYDYIREAYHPAIAFVYGWGLLLVTQTGGMAAVAVTFARYFRELTRLALPDGLIGGVALAGLTVINCFGVRAGGSVQSVLMVMKIAAITLLVGCGLFLVHAAPAVNIVSHAVQGTAAAPGPALSLSTISSMGAAMVPVLFAYGGWQTSCFVAGEIREPRKNLPRGLLIGVAGVIALYLAVNFVCLRALGPVRLAGSPAPASTVMALALGAPGKNLIAAGIAISTLGFLSQSILTAPRVYYAMAADGLFLKSVGWLHPRTRVPVVAIALQGIWAIAIGLSGTYDQILNYVVSVDFIFFGFTATCVFVFRRRATKDAAAAHRVPGHPWTTAVFVAVCFFVVVNTVVKYPGNTVVGLGILLAGVPAYFFWRWWRREK